MYEIQQLFQMSYDEYTKIYSPSSVQNLAARSIIDCKTGQLGSNLSTCTECGHYEFHHNSCRNRNCPCCQGISKELWIDARKSELIDAPYFHVVFTLPAQLRPLIYANQSVLYTLMHQCSSRTLLEVASDKQYLGATPGIIQVLHTFGQQLNYHPHIHCIVTGAGISPEKQLRKSSPKFLAPVQVLGKVFRGKFLDGLKKLYEKENLVFSSSCKELKNHYHWMTFCDSLYKITWVPYTKRTFEGFGDAIDYLGRYTHRVAISNGRITNLTDTHVSFIAKDYETKTKNIVTISHVEFIRRFMMHILPSGFQKIRYYGFLSNRYKSQNLKLLAKLTGKELFKSRFINKSISEIILALYKTDIKCCKACGTNSMRYIGKSYFLRN